MWRCFVCDAPNAIELDVGIFVCKYHMGEEEAPKYEREIP